jgi:hypothetical protein
VVEVIANPAAGAETELSVEAIANPAAPDSAEARKDLYAATEPPAGESARPRVRLPLDLRLPKSDLQTVIDHPDDYTKAELAELIATLRLLANECTAWAETLADELEPTFDELAKIAASGTRKNLH